VQSTGPNLDPSALALDARELSPPLGRAVPVLAWMLAGVLLVSCAGRRPDPLEAHRRRAQFVGLPSARDFAAVTDTGVPATTGAAVLLSPEITAGRPWRELIASWNVDRGVGVEVAARAIYPDHSTQFYVLGQWSQDTHAFPRRSIPGQKDADGEVKTDTLVLKRPCERVQLRLILRGNKADPRQAIRFLGLSFSDPEFPVKPLDAALEARLKAPRTTPACETSAAPDGAARLSLPNPLRVPERSQLDYEGGRIWCSPTSLSMILGYWADRLNRGDLDVPVPEVARSVFDPNWPGTGNWPFNMAYAGGFDAMRAYVTRLSDLGEVERWVEAGVPVALSVSYNRLKGLPHGGSGHLVVCIGFTPQGDVVLNDPGTRGPIRRVVSRATVRQAWGESGQTVYLVHPAVWPVPADRLGHWFVGVRR
jgi:hypothetical protein